MKAKNSSFSVAEESWMVSLLTEICMSKFWLIAESASTRMNVLPNTTDWSRSERDDKSAETYLQLCQNHSPLVYEAYVRNSYGWGDRRLLEIHISNADAEVMFVVIVVVCGALLQRCHSK